MRIVASTRRRVGIVAAVVAISLSAAGCLSDNTGSVGPEQPFADSIFRELNAARRANGLPELGYSPRLGFDAGDWAWKMSQSGQFVHQDLGALLFNPDHGAYRTLGENILMGPWYMNAQYIVSLWMGSPPHRANILSRDFNVVGVGFANRSDGSVWISVVFGGL
jgi:uncharacterized protein YkwD